MTTGHRFRLTDKSIYLKVTTPFGENPKLILTEVDGREAISKPFHFTLTMKAASNTLNFKKILGKSVTVSFELNSGKKRYINGIVTRFAQGDNDGEVVTCYADIRPWLWELTLTSNSRIFQEMTTAAIIKKVFDDLGFTDYSDKTGGGATRVYCVQYQETAFDFVCRLMEEEGFFYFFEHVDGKHTLVMADASSAFTPCPAGADARFNETDRESDDIVENCHLEENVVSNEAAVEDYNFETPATDLLSNSKGKVTGKLRHYEYPGRFTQKGDGQKIADKRMEAHEVPSKLIRGDGFHRAFTSGYKFTLSQHDRKDLNAAWVIQELEIFATPDRYTNRFIAFPPDIPFRPPRVTPRPRIHGSQTALVVGKSGEEIWPDKYGRIKVQFHWDQEGKKDEKSSCWIRVAQMWAGKNWGTMFIPRIGAEVVVSFLEGDPDQPLVIGTVYNATQTIPYTQPDEKTKSTIKTDSSKGGAGFNEIRFEDKKDSEEIFIHAQKDMNTVVEKNRTTTVKEEHDTLKVEKGNRTAEVTKGNETLTVGEGNRLVEVKKGNQTLTVGEGNRIVEVKKGNETHSVKGTRGLSVDGNETHDNAADFQHTVKGKYTLKVTGDLLIDVTGKVTIKSGQDMTIQSSMKLTEKSSMDMLHDSGMNLTNKSAMNLENNAGMNLTNKGAINLDNKAGAMMTNKASAMQEVDGGGMLQLKGGLVKIG